MKVLITGGAGFIGSNLADALLLDGHEVRVADNLSTGQRRFLEKQGPTQVEFLLGDLFEADFALRAIDGCDAVVHLAANADVRFGWSHPKRDLEQNVMVTHYVLEGMRKTGCRKMLFSSTGSVYGQATVIPTPENAPFPRQTSLYGASKAAAEGFIAAYAEAGVVDATICRFVSILGPRYTHGHVIDFVAQLSRNPNLLTVLGNGHQTKSYLHVSDCVQALKICLQLDKSFEVFNLGSDDSCTVRDSISWITDEMGLSPSLQFGSDVAGWVGDNPHIYLDTSRIRSYGWSPQYSIEESVRETVRWISDNSWVLSMAVD